MEMTSLEVIESYKYLCHNLKLNLENNSAEITVRIGLDWAAFGKLIHIQEQNEQQLETLSVRFVCPHSSQLWS